MEATPSLPSAAAGRLAPAWMAPDELDELYQPIRVAGAHRPITVGHLGQSLDGCIATRSGDSHYVNGDENLVHLHRMRALCDAVVVGAGTVEADDPRLTTRHVPGPNPVRVVIDPNRRLGHRYRVFSDGDAPTLHLCHAGRARGRIGDRGPRTGEAEVVGIEGAGPGEPDGRLDLGQLLAALHARGLHRVFVEGGGRTVSAFLAAGRLDRLHLAVAPLVIGEGRPAVRVPLATSPRRSMRPAPRVYRMGCDVLFDCELVEHL